MDTKSEVPKLLVSKREAALALGGLSIRTIENLIAKKELTARRVGRRTLVVASSLQSFARHDHASPSPPKRTSSSVTQGESNQESAADEGAAIQ